jgi:hypothetical protein
MSGREIAPVAFVLLVSNHTENSDKGLRKGLLFLSRKYDVPNEKDSRRRFLLGQSSKPKKVIFILDNDF